MDDRRLTRWHETREMLGDLLAWLDETRQWAEMAATGDALEDDRHVAQVSVVSAAAEASDLAAALPGSAAANGPGAEVTNPDLFALLASLTALRQEVKLQTRSARHDREQATQTLDQLAGVVVQLERNSQEASSQHEATVEEISRTAADTLMELHDSLSRAALQASHILDSVVTTLRGWDMPQSEWSRGTSAEEEPQGAVPKAPSAPSTAVAVRAVAERGVIGRVRGWFGRAQSTPASVPLLMARSEPAARPKELDLEAELCHIKSAAAHLAARLEGVEAGQRLSVQRLERLLATFGIEPIACIGQPVDADLMEVVQIVSADTQPSGIVMDEVRRGYRRHGQVHRFAQVVATRFTAPESHEPALEEAEGEAGASTS